MQVSIETLQLIFISTKKANLLIVLLFGIILAFLGRGIVTPPKNGEESPDRYKAGDGAYAPTRKC